MLAAESTILEHLDTVRLDLDVFKHARTFVLEQQGAVVHACHSHGVRYNCLYGHILVTSGILHEGARRH